MRPMHAPIRTIALICACLGAAACGAQQPELVTVDSPTGAEVLEVRDGMVSEFAEPDLVATKAWKLWCWVRSADGQRIIVTPRVFSLSGGETKMVPHILPATVWGDWKEVGFTFTVAEGEDRVEVRWAVAPDRPIYVAGLELSPASDPGGYENIEPPAHPYLYFRKEDIPKLAEKTRQPIAKDIWERVKQEADRLLASALPRLTGNSENTEGQLRRQYHDVVVLSFVYALTSDERYAERAKREIAAVLADEGWGEPGMLSSGLSLGLALGYDWLYDYLTDEERGRLRKAVLERGLEPIFRASYDGRIMSNRYRCNWGAVIHGNAGTAALALLGEDPRVPGWINICQEKIRLHRAEMGRDGGWGEGATYTTLAWMCATKFMAALHNVSDGRDNLFDDPRLRQAHLYHIYLLEPDYDGFVRFSNCGRGVHRHGDYYYKFAAEFRDPYAQWLGELMQDHRPYLSVTGFIWCDPTLEPKPPWDLPLARHFRDIQWATMRTSWTDPNAILFGLKGGYNDWDHHHHDLNHFVLYAYGQPLITDLGYPRERWGCLTEAHNTIMVNGKEQLDGVNVAGGRGGADHCAEITEFMHTAQYDYLKGDASQGYDPEDVTSFTREVIFVRPDYFILFDQVLATKPSRFDWHLHTLGQMIVEGDTISVRQDEAAVAVKMLVPAAFEHEVLHTSCPIAGNPPPMIDDTYLKLWPAEQSDSANFLTVLFPQPVEEGQEPVCPSVKTINADGLLGALIEDGEVRDIALFALGDEPIEFEDISTDAARCFVRFKQGHPSQFAVHHATFLQVGEHRVFESPGAISEARLLSERGSDL